MDSTWREGGTTRVAPRVGAPQRVARGGTAASGSAVCSWDGLQRRQGVPTQAGSTAAQTATTPGLHGRAQQSAGCTGPGHTAGGAAPAPPSRSAHLQVGRQDNDGGVGEGANGTISQLGTATWGVLQGVRVSGWAAGCLGASGCRLPGPEALQGLRLEHWARAHARGRTRDSCIALRRAAGGAAQVLHHNVAIRHDLRGGGRDHSTAQA